MKTAKLAAAVRKKRGKISLRDAAREAGLDFGVIDRAEKRKKINADNLVKLCRWINLDPRKLQEDQNDE